MFASALRGYVLKSPPCFLNKLSQMPNFRSPAHRLLHQSPLLFNPKTSTDLQKLTRNQTNVTTTLANHLFTNKFPESNVVFSPFTIHFVLFLLAAGSRGRTLDQLLDFLKANTVDELKSLYSQFPSKDLDDGPVMGPKNEIRVSERHFMKPPQEHGEDKVSKATFQVNYSTKVSWIVKFDCSKTKESEFNLLNGNKVKVPYITNNEKQYACAYTDFKVLRYPYSQHGKQKCSMLVFLPNTRDGIRSLFEKISSTTDFIEDHIPYQKVEMGKFLIPKFKLSFNFEASDLLKELGLVLPFFGESGMTEIVDVRAGHSIYLGNMPQNNVVEVNDEGTKHVAESTFVENECKSMDEAKMDFVADHPFVFVIRVDGRKTVLLMGQMVDPRVS